MQLFYKDQHGNLYVQKVCEDCGQSFIHRKSAKGACPFCQKVKRRSKPDLSDPAINRTYASYYAMLSRCLNTAHKDFPNYGGRGVCIHPAWIESFENFVADLGLRPVGTSLDRKDYNGHYVPDNCRWATMRIQNMNKRKIYQGKLSLVHKPQAKSFLVG